MRLADSSPANKFSVVYIQNSPTASTDIRRLKRYSDDPTQGFPRLTEWARLEKMQTQEGERSGVGESIASGGSGMFGSPQSRSPISPPEEILPALIPKHSVSARKNRFLS
jgi:hypothetical protein